MTWTWAARVIGALCLLFSSWIIATNWKTHPNFFGLEESSSWKQIEDYPVSFKKNSSTFPYSPLSDQQFVSKKSFGQKCQVLSSYQFRQGEDSNQIFALSESGRLKLSQDKCDTWQDISGQVADNNSGFGIIGHSSEVTFSEWSPDGKWLASSSRDNSIRIWEAETLKQSHVLLGHEEVSFSGELAWSPDSLKLATVGRKDIRIWDVQTGKEIRRLDDHSQMVISLSWSPDGTKLISGSEDKTIHLRDISSGKLLRKLTDHTDIVTEVAWSPKGDRFASLSWDGSARIWSAEGDALFEHEGAEGFRAAPRSMDWHQDGQRLAIGYGTGIGHIFDATNGKLLHTLSGHSADISSVSWDKDGNNLASGSRDKTVRIWSSSGQHLKTLSGARQGVSDVAWNPKKNLIAASSLSDLIHVWDLKTGAQISEKEQTSKWKRNRVGDGKYVNWKPDGTRLVVNSKIFSENAQESIADLQAPKNARIVNLEWHNNQNKIGASYFQSQPIIWDVNTGNQLYSGPPNFGSGWMSWSPNGTQFVISGGPPTIHDESGKKLFELGKRSNEGNIVWGVDNKVSYIVYKGQANVWDGADGKLLKEFETGYANHKLKLHLSPDGKYLAKVLSGTMTIWDISLGKQVLSLKSTGVVGGTGFDWSPDSKKIAFSAKGNPQAAILEIWDVETGTQYAKFTTSNRLITHIQWAPTGDKILFSSLWDKHVSIWNTVTKDVELVITGMESTVPFADWSHDSTKIATASWDNNIYIWDTLSKEGRISEPIRVLRGHTNQVSMVKWNAAGSRVVSASEDKTIRMWDTKSGENTLILRSAYQKLNSYHHSVFGKSLKLNFSNPAKIFPVSDAVWVAEDSYLYRFGLRDKSYLRLQTGDLGSVDAMYEANFGDNNTIYILAQNELYFRQTNTFSSYAILDEPSQKKATVNWSKLDSDGLDTSIAIKGFQGIGKKIYIVLANEEVWMLDLEVSDYRWERQPILIREDLLSVKFAQDEDAVSVAYAIPKGSGAEYIYFPDIQKSEQQVISVPRGLSILWWVIVLCLAGLGVFMLAFFRPFLSKSKAQI